MKRQLILAGIFVAAVSGCINTENAPETGGMRPTYGKSFGPPTVPGLQGPYGTPVPMASPYSKAPPGNQDTAIRMLNQNIPLNYVQQHPGGMPMAGMGGPPGGGMPNPMFPPGMISPPGVPMGPGMPGGMAPPGGMMPGGMMPPGGMPPGGMPPMGNPLLKTSLQGMMPDAGVMNANIPPSVRQPGGVLPAQFAAGGPVGSMFPAQRTQVYFGNPVRMKVYWYSQGADGKPNYSPTPLETPGRYNFAQGAIYRLKLTNIPGRPALELYPTLEVVPTGPKTNEFLAHNSVPVDFTEDDFKQVVDRNYIVKVIYLPDPQFQDAAGAGPGEINSTQLEPGQDPIQEALRRGSILLVMRIGNIDQGLISSPPTTAPAPSGPPMFMKPPFMGVPPGAQVPFPMTPIVPGMTPGGPGLNPNPLPPLGPGGSAPLPPPNLLIAPLPEKPQPSEQIKPPALPAPPGLKPNEGVKPLDLLPPPNVDKPIVAPLPPPNVDKPIVAPLPPPNVDKPAPIAGPPETPAKGPNNPGAFPIPPIAPEIQGTPTSRPSNLTPTPPAATDRPPLPPIPLIPDLPDRK